MKQFKKLAACLLAVVMALGMLTACGESTPSIDIEFEPEKKAVAVEAVQKVVAELPTVNTLTSDAKMETAAKKGLEPAINYYLQKKEGKKPNEVAFGLLLASATGYSIDELQQIRREGRYLGMTIPADQFSEEAVVQKLKAKFPNVDVSKYGMAVGTHDGVVFVAMFFE